MKVFILEDSHSRIKVFEEIFGINSMYCTKDVNEAKELYAKYAPFDLILLDHDLADEHYAEVEDGVPQTEGTGTEFAKWLAETTERKSTVVIHSYNPEGANRMASALQSWPVFRQPFGLKLIDELRKFVKMVRH